MGGGDNRRERLRPRGKGSLPALLQLSSAGFDRRQKTLVDVRRYTLRPRSPMQDDRPLERMNHRTRLLASLQVRSELNEEIGIEFAVEVGR